MVENKIKSTVGDGSGNKSLSKAVFSDLRMRIFSRVVLITLFTVLVFGGLGYFLDLKLDKSPLFVILGVAISYPVTQFCIYRMAKKISN